MWKSLFTVSGGWNDILRRGADGQSERERDSNATTGTQSRILRDKTRQRRKEK